MPAGDPSILPGDAATTMQAPVTTPLFEPQFGGLLDALPDGLVIAGNDGRIVYANRRLEELSGYAAAELVGQPIELLVPERMRGPHEKHRNRFLGSPTVRPMGAGLNIRLRRKDGSDLSADISLSPLATAAGRVVLATIRDVTDRREAEERLRTSEERFRLLVEWVQDYAIVMLEPDGRLASWNLGAQRITGYDAEEVIGRNIAVLYPPDAVDEGRPEQQLARARQTGSALDEGWRLRKDGSRFWASVALTALPGEDGSIRGFANVIRDMTERRQQASRLEAVAEITRAILQNRSEGEVLQIIATRARELVDSAVACVMTQDAGDGSLAIRVADGDLAATLVGSVVPLHGSLAGQVLRTRQPVATANASNDPRALRSLAEAGGFGPGLVVPLGTEERVFGAVAVSNHIGSPLFTPEDMHSLEVFAAQASVALEHGRIRGELQRLAIVEDRERIARELHDGIVQALFAVGLGLLSAEPLATSEPVKVRLREAVDSIDRVIADLRRYIFGLKPQAVGLEALGEALLTLATEFQARTQIVTAVEVDSRLEHASGEQVAEVVQIVREALSNVARHAHATTCSVSLRYEAPEGVLEIDDDGRGFDVDAPAGHGYGLGNLRERAAGLGGRLEITSTPGQGTTLVLRFPVEPSATPPVGAGGP